MTKNKFLATLAAFGLVAGALLSTTAPAFADKPADTGHTEIDLCHAKGPNQPTNGWTITPVDDSSVIDTAHFTNHEYDIIPITAGTPQGKNLDTVWGGYTGAEILANGCSLPTPPPPTDVCANIDGDQAEVPEGYTEDDGECTPPEVIDVCTNIDGDQSEVPEGYTEDDGECSPPDDDDVCTNIDGVQTEVPEGYTEEDGDCSPPVDVCSNIQGNQATVPGGYTEDDGECFEDEIPVVTKYDLCHATEVVNAKNGWLALSLPAAAIYPTGHSQHPGDIIAPIPPDYPGQNLTTLYPYYGPNVTGADVLAMGCPDSTPLVATATLEFIAATCEAAEQPKLPGSTIANATWGADTDADPLAYNIVATANGGAEFASGPGVSGDKVTKTFTGTLDDVLDDPSCDKTPDRATATLEFTPASCFAAESPNIGGSAISNATWGSDTDATPLGYSIVATANKGAEFADGDPGNTTKTFTGTLAPIFADNDPRCTLGLVMPKVVFTQATCSAAGSYTLGVADGYDPTHVTFTVNDVAGIVAGTYPVVGAQKVTVTVQAVAPNGLEIDWIDPPAFSFVNLGACGQLTTLALTGTAVSYLGWTLGGGALFLGAALLFMRRRSEKAGD